MALYPKGGPRPTSSNAELAFYKALMKGLPPGWQAWHSLKLRLGKDWEGEGDFVIAVPKRATVIVEEKGGAIECRDGQWLQNGKPMRSPREQAHRFRNILGTTLAKTVSVPPILIITAFPDTPFQLPPSHGDLADAVLGQQDLTWLGDALASLVERLLLETPPFGDAGWSAALHRLWGDTWVPRISLGTRIQLRDQQLVPLDQEQLLYLDMLDHSERLLVTGGPGTGKTHLAGTLCARRAPALYLCWTRALAQAMRGAGIDAWTVREYAGKLLEDAGQADGGPPSTWTTDYWEQVAFQAAIDAVPDAPAHAIVVVDEAQDFSENDWELVRALSTRCQLWAFGDQGQSFWAERTMPKGMFPASFQLRALSLPVRARRVRGSLPGHRVRRPGDADRAPHRAHLAGRDAARSREARDRTRDARRSEAGRHRGADAPGAGEERAAPAEAAGRRPHRAGGCGGSGRARRCGHVPPLQGARAAVRDHHGAADLGQVRGPDAYSADAGDHAGGGGRDRPADRCRPAAPGMRDNKRSRSSTSTSAPARLPSHRLSNIP